MNLWANTPLWLAAFALGCAVPAPSDAGVDAGPTPPPSLGHAHNDYEHPRPLLDALAHHFESVEVDVEFAGGEVLVTHGGAPYKGSLKALYLEPLKARIEDMGGSVYGDGAPFFLWVDLKQNTADLKAALPVLLRSYPMVSTFGEDGGTSGPVTVVLTGNDSAKKELVQGPPPRPFVRDSSEWSEADPPADARWQFYGLYFFSYSQWDGMVPFKAATVARLRELARVAKAGGRRVRLWGNPDEEAYWAAASDAGIDFINTDLLADFAAFRQGR